MRLAAIAGAFLALLAASHTQAHAAYPQSPQWTLFKPFKPLPMKRALPLQPSSKPVGKSEPVKVEIDRGQQKMNVFVGGELRHSWPVSTGRRGFKTPGGSYRPTWMTKMWHSKQWNNAPMPHSVFFKEGYAIHATYETGKLGRPASHGCVRLAPQNAAKLFDLIKKNGEKQTRIVVS